MPALWVTKVDGSQGQEPDLYQPGQYGETPSLLKTRKKLAGGWHTPVVPAAQEAEAGELLEPGRWRLQ